VIPHLPREQDAKLTTSVGVTTVTCASSIFWTRVFDWLGYEPTREAAMAALAKSWRRD
jgi:hypothetical protein